MVLGDTTMNNEFKKYTDNGAAGELIKNQKQQAAFEIEEKKYIVNQLEETMRNPAATPAEKAIASDMLFYYKGERP